METLSRDDVQRLNELIEGIPIAMMTTLHDYRLRSRPMACLERQEDGTLWFMTSHSSEKADEIKAHAAVNLAYSDSGQSRFVSVSGHATISDDLEKKKQLWNSMAKIWFSGPEDPDLALVCVVPDGAEYWDVPHNKMVALFGWFKTMVTGKPQELGENGTIGEEIFDRNPASVR